MAATLIGYATESLILEYATLAAIALILIGIYFFVINAQGRALERREIQILEAIKEPDQ
jgi:high-affinity Fe2+/Pb2+ permease